MIGYIFDFDGVLVDSLGAHWSSFRQACSEVGISVDKDKLVSYNGIPVMRQIELFAGHSGVQVDVDSVFERYSENYAVASLKDVAEIDSVIGIMRGLCIAGNKVAIASSGSSEHIRALVDKFDIPCRVIVSIDDVTRGKPHPDLFLEAAARLGVDPADCVVFEDSDIGIQAAERAGMATLRYTGMMESSRIENLA
ncbi:MAG: HAD family hydrolase [Armatimonadota bacterium]